MLGGRADGASLDPPRGVECRSVLPIERGPEAGRDA